MANSIRLINATCLTANKATTTPAVMTVRGPIKELEGEGPLLAKLRQLDPPAMLDAFERYGGPFNYRGRFVEDADGNIYACDRQSRVSCFQGVM